MSSLVFISGFSGSPIILKLSLLPLFSRSITLSVRYFMFSSNFLVFWLCFISSCFKAWFSFFDYILYHHVQFGVYFWLFWESNYS